MACHDTVSVQFHSLMTNTMFPTANQDIFILISDEQIDPVYNRETYKIKLILIVKFIFSTHAFADQIMEEHSFRNAVYTKKISEKNLGW